MTTLRPAVRLRLLGLGSATLLTATLAVTALSSAADATGAAYTGTPVGSLTLSPATGTDTSAINYTTSAGCPSGDSFYTLLFGAGMPDAGEVVTSKTSAGFSSSGPISSAFQNTPQSYATKNNATLSGTYDVVLRCTSGLSNDSKGDYRGRLTFTSPTTYTANGAAPSSSPSPSATPSAPPSATSTPSPSGSGTPAPSPSCPSLTLTVTTPTINATGLAGIRATGAVPGSTVELQGYSQNHYGTASFDNDLTNPDRTGTADGAGVVSFSDLRPASNTRVRARPRGCAGYSGSAVINVRAQETLAVTRTASRSYVITGNSIPARPGGLIIGLYRINGADCAADTPSSRCTTETLIGQGRASATTGQYRIAVTLPAADLGRTVRLVVKTGQDAQNAPGRSNVRSLVVT